MLNRKIEYYTKVPINSYVSSVHEQPVHTHPEDLELIVALKGTVKIIVGYRTLMLKEGEVFIFNDRDIHGVYETEENNIVLTTHINIKYFKKYNETDFSSFFLMAATYLNDARYDRPVEELKERLFSLAKMQITRTGSDENIEALGKELLQSLLSDFQYFYYNTSGGKHFVNRYEGKNNQAQAGRIRSLMYYLWENYNQKITLQEYANETHINMYYLSHIIKNSTGLNFQELLNFTRVEESEPLLLETNKKISEIAFECGFSATRYYVKYFEKWFQMAPNEYREKNIQRLSIKASEDILTAKEAVEAIDTFLGAERLSNSVQSYFYTDIVEIDIDKKSRRRKTQYQQLIEWDCDTCAGYGREHELVKSISASFRLCVRVRSAEDFNNRLLEFLQEKKSNSILFIYDTTRKTKEDYNKIFKALGEFCRYSELTQLTVNIEYIGDLSEKTKLNIVKNIIEIGENAGCKITVKKISGCQAGRYMGNYILDSIYVVPWIIRSSFKMEHDQKFINTVFDRKREKSYIINGDTGIFLANRIRKPSFYAYMCLSMLGDEILDNTDAYVATKKNHDIMILFYDYDAKIFSNIDEYTDLNKLDILRFTVEKNKEYKLELTNLRGRYIATKINLGREICIFDKMMEMGMPKFLIPEEEKCMQEFVKPVSEFFLVDGRKGSASLDIKVPRYGASLLKLRRIME